MYLLRAYQVREFFYLDCKLLPPPPLVFILIFNFDLGLNEHVNILIALLDFEHLQDLRQVLDGALGHVRNVLEEVKQDWEDVLFCGLRPQNLSTLMYRVGQATSNLPSHVGYHLIVHWLQLVRPVLGPQSLKDRWKIVSAVKSRVVVNLLYLDLLPIRLAHTQKVVDNLMIWLRILK